MKKLFARSTKTVALLIVLAMCLLTAQAATASGQQRADAADRTVAHTKKGDLNSKIVGTTKNGRKVTGSFVPLEFSRKADKLLVTGLIQGVVHEKNGDKTTFAKLKKMRVTDITGDPDALPAVGRTAQAQATCDILNLVLGPLDLNLLGLEVHLDRVVLDIVAVTGAGNLLGNLLCAVAGLLDGGLGGALSGLLGQLVDVLNDILGVLRLG
ncbi:MULTISPECIES: hypothetical protein [unclassified Nocardioides]|uniref:hypothetical protein n=1 Tax=unclassified Nocardioides TaxID=2615069 RepID=UPI00360D43C1